jgi:hypothetical protein
MILYLQRKKLFTGLQLKMMFLILRVHYWKLIYRMFKTLCMNICVVTQSRTGLQIYEGHDDQLSRPGPMA